MGTKKNTDTVPAMLTPGEFVIKRDSAQKIGYDALELMNETGKVPDMKKHGGKMAGYLKSKFLNGMIQGYQKGGAVQVAQNQENRDLDKYLEGALKARQLSKQYGMMEGDRPFDISQKYGYGGMLLDQVYQALSGKAGTEYDAAQDIYGEGAPRPANITDILQLIQESKEDGGKGVKIPRGFQEGGEVEGLSPLQLSQLKGVGYNELLSVPRPQMMTEEQMEMFDDEGLLGQILTYGAPMENAAVEGDPYATKQEMAYNLLTGGPDMQNQIMGKYVSDLQAKNAMMEKFSENEYRKKIPPYALAMSQPEYTYDSDTDEYIYVGPGKGDESAQDAAIGDAYKYLGYQDGGKVHQGGRPINVLDIVERTGPNVFTPSPFTGSTDSMMIEGLIDYIMSDDYNAATGLRMGPKEKIDTLSTFGNKSALFKK